MTKPEITDGYVVIKNTKDSNNGKLVAQSLHTKMDARVWGDGNGEEYTINETVFKPRSYNTSDPDYRVELSPANPEKTDRLLTVIYVADATDNSPLIKAEEIETEELIGAYILGRALLFAKDKERLSGSLTVNLSADGLTDYYISGVSSGEWSVSINGKPIATSIVKDGEGILTFTAPSGKITITKITC